MVPHPIQCQVKAVTPADTSCGDVCVQNMSTDDGHNDVQDIGLRVQKVLAQKHKYCKVEAW